MPKALLGDIFRFLRRKCIPPEGQEFSDGALLGRFLAQRDEVAFEALMQRHGPMVLGVCRRVVGDAHAAEDAFQATFLVLARRAAAIRNQASVGSWLFGVAQRIACKARAQAAARRDRERQAANMPRTEPLDEPTWQELRGVLDEEVGRLPEKYRAAVVLCHLEGKSYEEAAQELGCPKSTLASRLVRALALLRGQLTRRGLTLSAGALTTALAEKAAAAAVPALLALNIVKAAASVAAGKPLAAGILSTQAIALAEEAMKTMIGIKMKLVVLVLALGLAVGAGYAGYRAWGEQTPPKVDEKQPPVAKEQPTKKDAAGPAKNLHGDPLPAGAVARLGTLRWLHGGLVSFAAFLPAGKQVVTASASGFGGDGTIRVWEFPVGKEIRRITLPAGVGRMHALSPDGKIIASARVDETEIYLHDLATGKQLPPLNWAPQELKRPNFFPLELRLAFSPNGEHLAALDRAGAVSIWDWAKAKEIRKFATDEGLPGAHLAYVPDGKSILTINTDNPRNLAQKSTLAVKLWDPATGKEKSTIGAALGVKFITALSFSPDSKTIGITTEVGTFLVETATGKQIRQLASTPTGTTPTALAFGKEGSKLYSSRLGGMILEYDVTTGKLSRQLQLPRDIARGTAISLSPDGNTLATPAGNHLELFDLSGKEIAALNDDSIPLSFLQYTPEGKTVLTGAPTQQWDAATGKALGRLDPPSAPGYRRVYSPDAKVFVRRVAVPGAKNPRGKDTLILIAADSGKEMGQLTVQGVGYRISGDGFGTQWGLRFAPDSKSFAVFQADKARIELYDVASVKLRRTFDVVPGLPEVGIGPRLRSHLVFSADGKMLAFHARSVFSRAATPVILFDTASGKQIEALPLSPPRFGAPTDREEERVAFSPDGRCLALEMRGPDGKKDGNKGTIGDNSVVLHELATGQPRWSLGKSLSSFAFSSDGRSLLYGGVDGTVHLWDMVTGSELAKFTGHTGSVNAVAFSPLGNTAASISDDCTGLVWDISKVKRPAPQPRTLKTADLQQHWQTLAETDAAKAWDAIRDLAAAPDDAVPFLKEHLKPAAPPDRKQVDDWIAQLKSAQFNDRERAKSELLKLDEQIVPALDQALASTPPLETRQRLEQLRAAFTGLRLQGERLRAYRAVEVLERIGTPQARAVLQALADGAPGARVTTSARAALKR